jgi:hypothetical protein
MDNQLIPLLKFILELNKYLANLQGFENHMIKVYRLNFEELSLIFCIIICLRLYQAGDVMKNTFFIDFI